jgi:hypothetical protein
MLKTAKFGKKTQGILGVKVSKVDKGRRSPTLV